MDPFGNFSIDFLDSHVLGSGFDEAELQVRVNGNLFDRRFFNDVAEAQSFFSHVIVIQWLAGLNNIQISFGIKMSGAGGFSFDYAASYSPVETPIPAALPLYATGLAALGLLARRRRKQAV
jgi:hypothetical protein